MNEKEKSIEKIVLKIIKAIQYYAIFCMAVVVVLTVEYGIDEMLFEMFIMSILALIIVYSTSKRLTDASEMNL